MKGENCISKRGSRLGPKVHNWKLTKMRAKEIQQRINNHLTFFSNHPNNQRTTYELQCHFEKDFALVRVSVAKDEVQQTIFCMAGGNVNGYYLFRKPVLSSFKSIHTPDLIIPFQGKWKIGNTKNCAQSCLLQCH